MTPHVGERADRHATRAQKNWRPVRVSCRECSGALQHGASRAAEFSRDLERLAIGAEEVGRRFR